MERSDNECSIQNKYFSTALFLTLKTDTKFVLCKIHKAQNIIILTRNRLLVFLQFSILVQLQQSHPLGITFSS